MTFEQAVVYLFLFVIFTSTATIVAKGLYAFVYVFGVGYYRNRKPKSERFDLN